MSAERVVVSSSVEPVLAQKLDDLAKAGERTRSQELRLALKRHLALSLLDDEKEDA